MPTTPKSSCFMPSSRQSSNQKPELALQRVVNADKSPIDKYSNASKKRKRKTAAGSLDHAVLDVAAQSHYRASLTKIQAIPSTPPVSGKFFRHQAADSPLTPSSLDQTSSRKANASPSGDHWYPNVSQSSRNPFENFKMASPEDIEDLSDNCMGSPAPRPTMNQDQLISANFLDKFVAPGQGFTFPISTSRNSLLYDVSAGHDINGLKIFQRETKQTNFEQQFPPIMGRTTQYVIQNQSSGSIEGRAGLQDAISEPRVAPRILNQGGCVPCGDSKRTSKFSQVLIDLTEPEEDDTRFGVCEKIESPSDPFQHWVPELNDQSDENLASTKQGCKKANPSSEQDSSLIQPEADIIDVAQNQNSNSGNTLAPDGMLAGRFSMTCALQNYIYLRKESNSNLERTLSHYFPVMKPLVVDDVSKYDKSENSTPIKNIESHTWIPPMAKPQCIVPTGRRYLVVSTCFLRNRKLACRIQRLYPGAEFIERDVALHEPSASEFQHCPDPTSQLEDNSPDEADMTISPGTGIILTTLQKIRQCSLPGQAVRLIVRERVVRVATRYERLFILVSNDNVIDYQSSESGNVAPHELDSDYKAAVDFIGFCSSLKQDTRAIFIAGKEEQLAEWIVAMIVKHSGANLKIELISEETTWELFLRKAGFNSFAAQAVIGELKGQSIAANDLTAGEVGLTAFIKMSVEKRVERFEEMFGGSELLRRVSSRLDARW